MAAGKQRPSVLVIVGPSASGKSRLAHKLALAYKAEIVCADSRTIYRGMNLGSAKPTEADQKTVVYWGLDLISPGESFSAARFKHYAEQKIREIQNREKLPIVVGGSGLYLDGLIFNYNFAAKPKPKTRQQLEAQSMEALRTEINKRRLKMPQNPLNKRHLVRALEVGKTPRLRTKQPPQDWLIVGLKPSDKQLKLNIASRVEQSFQSGLITEVRGLLKRHGVESLNRAPGIAYKVVLSVVSGKLDESAAKELIKTREWQYVRRQRTWLRRNPHIKWFANASQAEAAIIRRLNT